MPRHRVLRVGIVGLGVGEHHLLGFEQDPRCEVVAVCDLDRKRLDAVAAGRSNLRTTTDAAELIGSDDIDVVSIASYDDVHFEQALAALEAGRHAFVEKPLCRTLDEAHALKDALSMRPHLRVASNLVLRAAPLYRFLRDSIAAGDFGRVYGFDGDYLYGRLRKITEGWRRDVAEYSVMLGGGIHLVDLMLWTTDERPLRVSAAGNRISTDDTEFRYFDFVSATFEFPSGLIGRITANFGSVHPHQHVVRVFGTGATFVHDDRGTRLFRSREQADEPQTLAQASLPASKAKLVPDFVESIFSEDDGCRAQHEFDVIAACVAADRAVAEGGGPVDIQYV